MKRAITLALLTLAAINVRAERETVDKIIAVVGDQVILASELAGQMQLLALQTGQRPKTEEELKQFKQDVLDQMVSDQLFLIAAQQDTSISVRAEEIDQALDEHIARISRNFPSNDAFLEALAAEGLTLRELKKQYRPDVENQILKQRFVQKKLSTVAVSRHEVEEFYRRYEDSLPTQPEAVKLAHILLKVEPSPEIEDSVSALAAELRRRVLDGADFAAISTRYSSLGAGENGGDLGYVARDDVVPEFARAAFNLSVGDVSGVIRTQFGYHVIKCEGKQEDRLRLRHILLAVQPSPQDTQRVVELADSLIQEARSGGDFAQMAKVFSADNDSRAQGGELGWFAMSELPAVFAAGVADWNTPGEYRGPVTSQFGVHLLKLLDHTEERTLQLDKDFDEIKELARREKTARLIDEWVAEIKKKTYIDYRL
ncbi:MAG: peptidylprolyl isomerase [Candidatus Zixiibacteriota bacterium]